MNKMKLIFISILLLFILSCSQGPNLTKEMVVWKTEFCSTGVEYYITDKNNGVRGAGWGFIVFIAPYGFARIGDKIMLVDNTFVVTKNWANTK